MSQIDITDKRAPKPKGIRRAAIPMGTYFMGKVGDKEGLFVRAFEVIVLLRDPANTWSLDAEFPVTDYQAVDVEILVQSNAYPHASGLLG